MHKIVYEAIVPAHLNIPGATIDTMLRLLKPGGLPRPSRRAPGPIQRWLNAHLKPRQKGERADEFADGMHEIAARIEGLACNAVCSDGPLDR